MFDLTPDVLRSLPVWFVATLLSMTLHEAAHALVGRWGGDDTASDQVTLDPTPHIRREPVGMILVPIVSFLFNGGGWMIGWASAPYDPFWAQRHPKKAALMAAAGPISNFLLAGIGALLLHLGIAFWGWSAAVAPSLDLLAVGANGEPNVFATFASILFSVNVLLGMFNLLPIPPLDGHAVVPIALNERQTQRWFSLFADRTAGLIGLVVAFVVFYKLAYPVWVFSLKLLYPSITYS